uniref:ceramide glucosyltransferase n=1 Tax=Plectus sambesii TaxID=2011161 RepID=A0A914W7F0_9BILA
MRLSSILFYLQAELLLVWFALALFIFWGALWLVHFISLAYAKWRLYRKPKPREGLLPGVSVIKPLVGVDANLATNLETFFTLQYPTYELLFCVHSESDPALMVVQMLMNKYKDVDARIFVGGEQVGLNPKINNMMPAYSAAKHEFVLVSDSNIFMREDALLDMVLSMSDNVALVTQTPYCMDRKGLGSNLEQIYFGTSHARIYMTGNCLGFVCSTGMSSLIRKCALDDVGGMRAFSPYLAEDYFFGVALAKRGWLSVISGLPALQNGSTDVHRFHDRICRWIKLRVAMLPHTIILEPMQDCMMAGLMGSWAANMLFDWNSLVFFLVHVLMWMLFDYMLICTVQNGPLSFGKFEFAVMWLYRELSALPIYIKALWEPRIRWRAGLFKLRWGGLIEEVPEKR